MDDSKIKQLLAKSSRFVAFVDVLGYRSIVTGDLSDESKFKRLHSLFEGFGVAFFTAVADFNQDLTPADPTYVDTVSFSDSLYLSCKELPSLLLFLEGLFSVTYGFQEHTYRTDPDNWTPFIRAGIVFGWTVNFRDVSMRPMPDRSEFRNPVGPAVADAYTFTEKTGRLRGMRCYLRRSLVEAAGAKRINDPAHFELATPSRTLRLLEVPAGDACDKTLDLVELAWPIHAINGGNVSFYKPLIDARGQCTRSEAVKHYNGTVDLFERSIQVVSDRVAKQIWTDKAGKARLLVVE